MTELLLAAPQPLEQDLEALELGVAADKGRRRGASVGGVGVRAGVDLPTLPALSR